jgi:hypothetical protein
MPNINCTEFIGLKILKKFVHTSPYAHYKLDLGSFQCEYRETFIAPILKSLAEVI